MFKKLIRKINHCFGCSGYVIDKFTFDSSITEVSSLGFSAKELGKQNVTCNICKCSICGKLFITAKTVYGDELYISPLRQQIALVNLGY